MIRVQPIFKASGSDDFCGLRAPGLEGLGFDVPSFRCLHVLQVHFVARACWNPKPPLGDRVLTMDLWRLCQMLSEQVLLWSKFCMNVCMHACMHACMHRCMNACDK